jgi:anti-sigma B factor antagonist
MEIKLSESNGIAVAAIEGEINISTSPQLKKEMEKVSNPKLVINLSKVNYVDSSGLATLVEILKKTRSRGGAMYLTHLSDKVRSLFEITKLDKLFGICPDDMTAVGKFK